MAYGNIRAAFFKSDVYCIPCVAEMIAERKISLVNTARDKYGDLSELKTIGVKNADRELAFNGCIGINGGRDLVHEGQKTTNIY